jgi:hypothetical protein
MGAIAGRCQRGKAVLLADGRLNVEISPALAKRKRRLRDPDIVGDLVARADGVVAERLRDLEKAGNDVIAALLIGGNKAVFGFLIPTISSASPAKDHKRMVQTRRIHLPVAYPLQHQSDFLDGRMDEVY